MLEFLRVKRSELVLCAWEDAGPRLPAVPEKRLSN
jgi:hypothetical protein